MNVLIIGGTGFIGINLANKLISQGNKVSVVGIPSGSEKFDVYNVSLTEANKIIDIIKNDKITHVIHLANSILPNSTFEEYINSVEDIILPTYKIIEYCAKVKNIKFVFYSSGGTIYGNQNNCSEDVKPRPTSFYGYSKQIIEDYLIMKQQEGLDVLILRPSNPYGHGQNLNGTQGIIAVALGKAIKNQELSLFSPINSKKDYIYIDDLVDITIQLSQNNSGIYNIGSGVQSSLGEIFALIEKYSNKKLKLNPTVSNKNYIHEVVMNIDKLKVDLPDFKFLTLEKGIERFIEETNTESLGEL
ncbi:hypothetical protein GJ496_006711 [Pomphorhynchus laevis]|nr:hypothetical protein GJ496_006711 [Pomphorhynchus laevis]